MGITVTLNLNLSNFQCASRALVWKSNLEAKISDSVIWSAPLPWDGCHFKDESLEGCQRKKPKRAYAQGEYEINSGSTSKWRTRGTWSCKPNRIGPRAVDIVIIKPLIIFKLAVTWEDMSYHLYQPSILKISSKFLIMV